MSKIFKSDFFKCITVLLVLSVILCGTLAVLNDLLKVDPSERTARAIKKIYGEEKEFSTILEDEQVNCLDFGYIDKIYLVHGESQDNYDYLFHTTGIHGYKDGSITYWIKVTYNAGQFTIGNMVVESNKGQSFIGNLTSDWHASLYVDVNDSKYLTPWKNVADKNSDYTLIPTTGATNSKTASCNAVNSVIYFITQGGLA